MSLEEIEIKLEKLQSEVNVLYKQNVQLTEAINKINIKIYASDNPFDNKVESIDILFSEDTK
ncbi:hypothetical protein ACRASX_15115 [Flavobacterium sp. TMP13]|uniref:hypothetical protein n=1 Tax=Flavobacterium sp. TMP13 TaxID=3425950 RepID=UPI003D782B1D